MYNKLSKNFGMLLSTLGFIVFFLNIYSNYNKTNVISYVNNFNLITLFVSIVVLLTSFYSIGAYVQIICLSITCLLTFQEDPTQGIAVLQLILIVFLAYKHDLLKTHLIKKALLTFLIIILTISSSIITMNLTILHLLPTILFSLFFVFSITLIMKDEIALYLTSEKIFRLEIIELNRCLKKSLKDLDDIRNDYINPVDAGLTTSEMILLEKLCMYKETNNDIARRLNKSPNTVKVQLTKIMIKIGVETRYQLIDMCKNYFLDLEENTKSIDSDI